MNINKIFIFLFFLFFLIISSNSVSAYILGFDYMYVRSDSYFDFAPYQYSNYYDNIDFQYSIYTQGIPSVVPVVLTPIIYGVTPFGSKVYVSTAPTQTIYITPNSSYIYTYNNLFYFDADYESYEIQLNAHSLDGQETISDEVYVYYTGTYVNPNGDNNGNTNPPVVDCSKFYLSGQTDIYLDEDEEYAYDVYISNTISNKLDLLSVTTNNPINLDVDNISYPYEIDGYLTRSITIDLTSDTVSNDYSGSFDIYLTGMYDDLSCEKSYTVNYHIDDQENPSDADCDDISIENISLTINENDSERFDVEIKNESFDYEFDVDEIEINNSEYVDAEVVTFPSNINEDSSRNIKIRVDSKYVEKTEFENLTLKVKGYMTRTGREDKTCRINKEVTIKVLNSNSTSNSIECSNITVLTQNINQEENITKNYSNGFYINNNSEFDFIVSNISIKDNSSFADITNSSTIGKVNALSKKNMLFKVKTFSIDETKIINPEIFVTGYFENGQTCTYFSIKNNFILNIIDNADICSLVGVNDSTVVNGVNEIQIYNNSNTEFVISDFLINNKTNLSATVTTQSITLPANSTEKVSVSVSGESGSFDLLLKGEFIDTKSCDFTETKKGFLKTNDYSSPTTNNCEFDIDYPLYLDISELNNINFSFTNKTHNSGYIKIISDSAVVNNPIIYLDGYDNISKDIILSNFNNINSIYYKVKLYSCSEQSFKTTISSTPDINEPELSEILVVNYPTNLKSTNKFIFSNIQIKNNFNVDKTIKIELVGFPDDWNFMVNDDVILETDFIQNNYVLLKKNKVNNIYLAIVIPEDASNLISSGFLRVYSDDQLIFNNLLDIDRELIDSYFDYSYVVDEIEKNKFLLKLNIQNNSDYDRTLIFDVLNDDINVSGDLEFVSKAGESTLIEYTIDSINALNNNKLDFNIKDKITNGVVLDDEIILHKKNKILTGFFSFSSVGDIVKTIILILIIIAIVWIVIRNKRSNIKEYAMQGQDKDSNKPTQPQSKISDY